MKKYIFMLALSGSTFAVAGAQTFVAGFDFTNQTGAADVGDFGADVSGSQAGVSIDTSAFLQGSAFSGAALSLEARQVGFDTVGNAPVLSDFDGQNGFSSDPFGASFSKAAIDGLSFTIDIDTSNFSDITFGYDSFSDDVAVQTGGEWFTSSNGASDVSLDTVSFTGAYADNSYLIDTTGIDSLSLTFTFASLETDISGADVTGQRVHFDNFSIGGTVVPEPSTYAAIAGMLALAFAVNRRRKA